jgi:hypothetical protein
MSVWRPGGEGIWEDQEDEDINHGDYPLTDREEQVEEEEEVRRCSWGGCGQEKDKMEELYVC